MSNVIRKLAGEVGRLLLVYLLVFSQGARAAQDAKPADTSKPTQKTAVEQTREKPSSVAGAAKAQTDVAQGEAPENASSTEKLPRDGKREGIKVHGHWTIEVHNPDGALVSRRELENSLTNGAQALAAVLGHQNASGYWSVSLSATPSCGAAAACAILEASGVPTGGLSSSASSTLTAMVTNSGTSLTLSGNISAPNALSINTVQTALALCPPSITPAACNSQQSQSGFAFTQANVSPQVAVQTGQTIQVTVVFSFS